MPVKLTLECTDCKVTTRSPLAWRKHLITESHQIVSREQSKVWTEDSVSVMPTAWTFFTISVTRPSSWTLYFGRNDPTFASSNSVRRFSVCSFLNPTLKVEANRELPNPGEGTSNSEGRSRSMSLSDSEDKDCSGNTVDRIVNKVVRNHKRRRIDPESNNTSQDTTGKDIEMPKKDNAAADEVKVPISSINTDLCPQSPTAIIPPFPPVTPLVRELWELEPRYFHTYTAHAFVRAAASVENPVMKNALQTDLAEVWLGFFKDFNKIVWPLCFGIGLTQVDDAGKTSNNSNVFFPKGRGDLLEFHKLSGVRRNRFKANTKQITFDKFYEMLRSPEMSQQLAKFPNPDKAKPHKHFSFVVEFAVNKMSNVKAQIRVDFSDTKSNVIRTLKYVLRLYTELWRRYSLDRLLSPELTI